MKKQSNGKLIISDYKEHICSFVFDAKGHATQIYVDESRNESIVGNIYVGKVDKIVKNINAAFIEFLPGTFGYFSLDTPFEPLFVNPDRKEGPLRKGDILLVQVAKDAIKSKEPVLTCDITLTGKYTVLTLNKNALSFSNKFKDKEKKKEIRRRYNLLGEKKFGFIIRTNSEEADIEYIFEEIDFFSELILMVKDSGIFSKPLNLVYKAPYSYMNFLRDGYDYLIKEIITDNKKIYADVKDFLEKFQPADIKKLKFYESDFPLCNLYSFDKQFRDALNKKIWLKSGGFIVIEPTESLVAIDVNTGKYVSEKDSEEEYLKINLEAAEEIARQLLLRNLSGIIIVDFINMKYVPSKAMLIDYLKSLAELDPVKTVIVDYTKLNLVEITRKKIRKPIYELIDLTMLQ